MSVADRELDVLIRRIREKQKFPDSVKWRDQFKLPFH